MTSGQIDALICRRNLNFTSLSEAAGSSMSAQGELGQ
jgi:hypothetical protein